MCPHVLKNASACFVDGIRVFCGRNRQSLSFSFLGVPGVSPVSLGDARHEEREGPWRVEARMAFCGLKNSCSFNSLCTCELRDVWKNSCKKLVVGFGWKGKMVYLCTRNRENDTSHRGKFGKPMRAQESADEIFDRFS